MSGSNGHDMEGILRVLGETGDDTAPARQDLVYGIGRYLRDVREPGPLLEALVRTLRTDVSPQVRRAAAITLGKGGHAQAIHGLAGSLAIETDPAVRASAVLALGAIGGDGAIQCLGLLEPRSGEEADALRKALEKGGGGRGKRAAWVGEEPVLGEALLEVPRGLERECIGYCAAKGFDGVHAYGDGMLRVAGPVTVSGILGAIRCCYGIRIPIEGVVSPGPLSPRVVEELVREFATRWDWRRFVATESGTLRFRFSVEGAKPGRDEYLSLLGAARRGAQSAGMTDSASDYGFELICSVGDGIALHAKPSFVADKRFVYRVEDVGASINPAIAAVLAHLSHTGSKAAVLDPTCGSGTLLVERHLYDRTRQAVGIDISKTAIAAMKANLKKAGLLGVIRSVKGDARDPGTWPDHCDEVIANLPFGIRVKGEELSSLYSGIVGNAVKGLRPGGRIVLYTAARKHLEAAVSDHPGFIVEKRLLVHSGGLTVHVWVLVKRTRA